MKKPKDRDRKIVWDLMETTVFAALIGITWIKMGSATLYKMNASATMTTQENVTSVIMVTLSLLASVLRLILFALNQTSMDSVSNATRIITCQKENASKTMEMQTKSFPCAKLQQKMESALNAKKEHTWSDRNAKSSTHNAKSLTTSDGNVRSATEVSTLMEKIASECGECSSSCILFDYVY